MAFFTILVGAYFTLILIAGYITYYIADRREHERTNSKLISTSTKK